MRRFLTRHSRHDFVTVIATDVPFQHIVGSLNEPNRVTLLPKLTQIVLFTKLELGRCRNLQIEMILSHDWMGPIYWLLPLGDGSEHNGGGT